jgi:hypothetical protein
VTFRSSSFWSAVFWATLVFQLSVLPDILHLNFLSRIVNVLTLAIFAAWSLRVLAGKQPPGVLTLYCLPCILVIVGFTVNIARSVSLEALSHVALVLPWLAALSVPFVRPFDCERYWRLYYRFMMVVAVVSIAEFAAVFAGLISTSPLDTPRGVFLKGIFTIFGAVDGDVVYNRLYGIFGEPGSCAMLVLPAMAYALERRKILGIGVLLVCMLLTTSLGGYFGLAVLLVTFACWVGKSKSAATRAALVIVVLLVLGGVGGTLYGFFSQSYMDKGASAGTRESNVSAFFHNFMEIAAQEPWGMQLKGESQSALGSSDPLYIGSNFSIGNALVIGGVMALLGYSIFFLASIVCWLRGFIRRADANTVSYAYISLPAMVTFIFQRTTVYDSALFAFLYAAPMLAMLQADPSRAAAYFLMPPAPRVASTAS